MSQAVRVRLAPWLLASTGLALAGVAAVWHLVIETQRLGWTSGPVLAFLLDGLLPLTLVYGSYRLVSTSLSRKQIWTVFVWSLTGGAVVGAVIGLSVLIRMSEGRAIAEPVFIILLAAETGTVAGFVAGTYAAKARRVAGRASNTTNTLSFVNDMLRHDVKNGLMVINGRSTSLERNAETETEQVAAQAIQEQVMELEHVIDNAGAIVETLASDSEFEAIDITDIAETVTDRIRRTHDVDIELRGASSAEVRANEAVRSVLLNLLENAVEHGSPAVELSAEGTVTDGSVQSVAASRSLDADVRNENDRAHPSVLVWITVADDTVETHILDDGPGIPVTQRETLFEERADETHGGGLHLVRTLVDSFGGEIRLAGPSDRTDESLPDMSGAHFVVELPRA